MFTQRSTRALAFGTAAIVGALCLAPTAVAQRRNDWDWDGNYRRLAFIPAGTFVGVRTAQPIEVSRHDRRIFQGIVAKDVWDDYGRLANPAIPAGSRVDLIVREARDGDLVVDLDAIYAHGLRYAVRAQPQRVEGVRDRDGRDTAAWVGGGAVLGSIIGAIADGGKGAAIGAGAGAASGLGGSYAFQGHSIRLPKGALLTFRLDQALDMGVRNPRQQPRRSTGTQNYRR